MKSKNSIWEPFELNASCSVHDVVEAWEKEMAAGGFVFVLFLTIEYNEMGIIPKSKYSNSPRFENI